MAERLSSLLDNDLAPVKHKSIPRGKAPLLTSRRPVSPSIVPGSMSMYTNLL